MSLLDFMQDTLPESWFDNIRVNYGDTLTDEMISQSVQTSCEFFNLPMPELVAEFETTGVFPLDSSTVMDDILIFSREQLVNMGITQQDGLDLVMTHEQGHRALQSLNLDFDSHKEELCCDFMAGVRAGLNGMDFYQMERPLEDTIASDTHPGGADRIEAIEAGVKFAKEYYEVNNVAPAFSDCLDYFIDKAGIEGNITPEQINLRPDDNISFRGGETAGSAGFVDSNNVSFRGGETAGSAGFVGSDNISFKGDSGETAGGAGFVDSDNISFKGDSGETAGGAGFVDSDNISFRGDSGETAGGAGFVDSDNISFRGDSGETAGSAGFVGSDNISFKGDSGETAGGAGFVDSDNISFRGDSGETAGSAGFVDSDNISFRGDSGETAGSAGFVDSDNISFRGDGGETTGTVGFVDNDVDEKDPSFKGYTQSEINSRISKAKHEMSMQESNMRHRVHMMKSKARMNEPYSYEEYQYNQARRAYNEAASELNKWRNMKPDVK